MARSTTAKAAPKSPAVKKSSPKKSSTATKATPKSAAKSKSPAVKKKATPAKPSATPPAKKEKAATLSKSTTKEPAPKTVKKATTPAKRTKLPKAEAEDVTSSAPTASTSSQGAGAWSGLPDKYALPLYFFFWYAGNMAFNKFNTAAITEVGKLNGMTFIISTMQLGSCVIWGCLLWLVGYNPVNLLEGQKPAPQPVPTTTQSDLVKSIPVGMCSAGAHGASVLALGADPLFGQIVKAAEPVFSALVNSLAYKSPPSLLKVLCLPVIVGGVAFASLKPLTAGAVGSLIPGYALSFNQNALLFGVMANVFAAFKGGENKKLMEKDPGLKERIGSIGNQFAITQMISFSVSLPVMFYMEGAQWSAFLAQCWSSPTLVRNVFCSGISFYVYDELATMTVKACDPVTSSVANTAKRVIVMLYMAAVTGKALTHEQALGAGVAIAGVFLYSIVDDLSKKHLKSKRD